MNPDLSRTLAELASKLGTTADRLWPVLVVVGFITCDTYVDYRFPEAAALQRLLHQ